MRSESLPTPREARIRLALLDTGLALSVLLLMRTLLFTPKKQLSPVVSSLALVQG